MEYYHLEARVKANTAFAVPKGRIQTPTGSRLVEQLIGLNELPYQLELMDLKKQNGRWEPVEILISELALWVDYQPNEWAYPMMSERMADIVKSHLTGEEGIDWISAQVTAKEEKRVYFIPRFSKLLDTLDSEKTTRTPGGLTVRSWFALEKIKAFSMFQGAPEFWEITPSLVVNESLMKALKKAKLTGIGFSPARFS